MMESFLSSTGGSAPTDPLLPEHRRDLEVGSGISPEVIAARGYRSVTTALELSVLGFSGPQSQTVPALVIPLHGPAGPFMHKGATLSQARPDNPRKTIKGKAVKYETPRGSRTVVDAHPMIREALMNPAIPLWITEGIKKVDACVSRGICCVGLLGVANSRGRNGYGGKTAHPEWNEIPLNGREVFIAFDSDAWTNENIGFEVYKLASFLRHKEAKVKFIKVPSPDGRKVGLDDYFVAGGTPERLIGEYLSDLPPDAGDTDIYGDDGHPLSDVGNAARFLDAHESEIRWCAKTGRWFTWRDPHWNENEPGGEGALHLAKLFSTELMKEKKMVKHAMKLQSVDRLGAMLRLAKSDPRILVEPDDFDSDAFLLGCANGVIDLRTKELLPPDPSRLVSRYSPYEYDPSAQCPRFKQFLAEIMEEDEELVTMLLHALGYSITGSIREHKWFVMHGSRGRNGKSTLIETMERVLGHRLAYTMDEKAMTGNDFTQSRFALSEIEGKRFLCISEANSSSRLDTAFVKKISGDSILHIERKGVQGYNIVNKAKLFYAVNSLPTADTDAAFMSRMIPIPFNVSFRHKDDLNYREGDVAPDRELDRTLMTEAPGILNLLVKSCYSWQQQGEIRKPARVQDLVSQYESENNPFTEWLEDRTTRVASARHKMSELQSNYNEYMSMRKMPIMKRPNEFAQALRRIDGLTFVNHCNRSMVVGLLLNGSDQNPMEMD